MIALKLALRWCFEPAGAPRALAGAAALAALLAGCGTTQPTPANTAGAAPPAAQSARPAGTLDDFNTRHALAAETAAREGRWTDAVFALDVLLALRPDDAGLLRLREHAVQSAGSTAAARAKQARAAQQRGDTETASRLYLEVLVLAPDSIEAADSLRTLERERNRRVQRNRAARSAAVQRGSVDAAPGSAASTVSVATAPQGRAPGGRNDIEHANLLADQGEFDGAIAILEPAVASRRPDPAARTLLADLYVRKAETLRDADGAAAIRALEQSLKVDPKNARARQLLLDLRKP